MEFMGVTIGTEIEEIGKKREMERKKERDLGKKYQTTLRLKRHTLNCMRSTWLKPKTVLLS